MREKANPAVRAGNDAPAKLGMELQDRVQHGLILPDKRPGAIVPMPIRTKREKPLDGYGKKARPSVILLIVVDTPSSYLFDANASRGRARFFVRYGRGSAGTVRINGPSPIVHPGRSACRVGETRCALFPETTTWKKEALFFFPSSITIYLSREAAI